MPSLPSGPGLDNYDFDRCREYLTKKLGVFLTPASANSSKSFKKRLFPLNCCRRLAGHIIGDTVNPSYLIDDPARDLFQ